VTTSPLFVGIGLLVAFGLYRRIRRSIGRRKVTRAFVLRGGLSALIAVFLLASIAHDALAGHLVLLAGGALGVALGAILGALGLRLAEFEREAGDLYVTTNRYVSVAVVALLVVRIGYRLVVGYGAIGRLGSATGANATAPKAAGVGAAGAAPGSSGLSTFQDPLTLGVVGLLFAYYAVTYLAVVWIDRTGGDRGAG